MEPHPIGMNIQRTSYRYEHPTHILPVWTHCSCLTHSWQQHTGTLWLMTTTKKKQMTSRCIQADACKHVVCSVQCASNVKVYARNNDSWHVFNLSDLLTC